MPTVESLPTPEPEFPRIGGPLDDVNEAFHRDYGDARDAAEHEGPILVLLGDGLTLFRPADGGTTIEFPATPRVVHALKSVAHVPVGAFAIVHHAGRPSEAAIEIERLRDRVHATVEHLASDVPDPAMRRDCQAVLARTLAFLDQALQACRASESFDADAFAAELGPPLLTLSTHATRLQLDALDATFAQILQRLTPHERRRLHVVVAGAHQARARSLAMQYFQRCLGEPGRVEQRVTYAEAVTTVDAAIELVATQRLDRVIARAFFGDPARLQRDVLGDAAKQILQTADLRAVIEPPSDPANLE